MDDTQSLFESRGVFRGHIGSKCNVKHLVAILLCFAMDVLLSLIMFSHGVSCFRGEGRVVKYVLSRRSPTSLSCILAMDVRDWVAREVANPVCPFSSGNHLVILSIVLRLLLHSNEARRHSPEL